MMEEIIPKNLEEAIDFLLKTGSHTFNPTMGMRNAWGLWGGSELAQWFYERQIYHADDMSGIIVDSYHKTLVNEPINLDEQIKRYHKHWEKEIGKNHLQIMKKDIDSMLNKLKS